MFYMCFIYFISIFVQGEMVWFLLIRVVKL